MVERPTGRPAAGEGSASGGASGGGASDGSGPRGIGGPGVGGAHSGGASAPDSGPGSSSPDAGRTGRLAGAPNVLSAERYLAWLYTPTPQQPVLAALCEIESEIAGSLRPGIDHHVAHARLQWWREECERSAQGRAVHPLTRELVTAFGGGAAVNEAAALGGISGFVDTAVWDLAGATFETRKELTAYCERWAAAMFATAATDGVGSKSTPGATAHDVGSKSAPATAAGAVSTKSGPAPALRTLGAAVREVELLANLGREAHAGRVRLPLDELERTGVDVNSVAKPPWPAPLTSLVRERHNTLRAIIADSVAALGPEDQGRWRGLLVWAALARQSSLRAAEALPDVVLRRRYHALSDGWQAWRTARRAVAGTLRLK